MKLKCDICGRIETEPYCEGDTCFDGCGVFREVKMTKLDDAYFVEKLKNLKKEIGREKYLPIWANSDAITLLKQIAADARREQGEKIQSINYCKSCSSLSRCDPHNIGIHARCYVGKEFIHSQNFILSALKAAQGE